MFSSKKKPVGYQIYRNWKTEYERRIEENMDDLTREDVRFTLLNDQTALNVHKAFVANGIFGLDGSKFSAPAEQVRPILGDLKLSDQLIDTIIYACNIPDPPPLAENPFDTVDPVETKKGRSSKNDADNPFADFIKPPVKSQQKPSSFGTIAAYTGLSLLAAVGIIATAGLVAAIFTGLIVASPLVLGLGAAAVLITAAAITGITLKAISSTSAKEELKLEVPPNRPETKKPDDSPTLVDTGLDEDPYTAQNTQTKEEMNTQDPSSTATNKTS